MLTALASRSGDIDSLVTNLQTVSSALASKNTLLDEVVGNLSQVATDLASLIGNNHNTITSTIDNLQAVAADVQNNQQNLSNSLGTLGAGLAPYIQISQWGQWFAVETIYTCLAGQTICPYYEPSNPPPGSGPFGSPPLPAPLQNVTTPGLPNPNAPAASKGAVVAVVGVGAGPWRRRASGSTSRRSAAPGRAPRRPPREAQVKAVTERNPKVVGITAVHHHGGGRPGHPVAQPQPVLVRLHRRRAVPQRGGHLERAPTVMVAGVNVGLGHLGQGARATPSTPSCR